MDEGEFVHWLHLYLVEHEPVPGEVVLFDNRRTALPEHQALKAELVKVRGGIVASPTAKSWDKQKVVLATSEDGAVRLVILTRARTVYRCDSVPWLLALVDRWRQMWD